MGGGAEGIGRPWRDLSKRSVRFKQEAVFSSTRVLPWGIFVFFSPEESALKLSMGPLNTTKIWDTALGELQLQVTRPYYETYLKDTVGLECRDGRFVVGVPTAFGVEWLGQRMRPRVEEALRRIIKGPITAQFVLRQEHVPPNTPSPGGTVDFREEGQRSDDEVVQSNRQELTSRQLNPRYTFDSFVVCGFNRMAYAAARAVTESPGQTYNPLFIYSTIGLGKTHLLHAIGHVAITARLRVLYTSAEQFTNDMVTAIKAKSTEGFRDKYREVDVLLVDDVQFISAKEQTQEGLFHTFNHLHNCNKQIVLAADCHPNQIPVIHERLVSRFEGGLLADIRPPDLEARVAILQAKAKAMGLQICDEALNSIVRQARGSIRQLEGALHRVVAYASACGSSLTAELASEALKGTTQAGAPSVSAEAIIESAARHFDITPEELCSKRRHKKLVSARDIAIYLLHEELELSPMRIGALMGHRTPTSVATSCRKVATKITRDQPLKRDLSVIRDSVYSRSA